MVKKQDGVAPIIGIIAIIGFITIGLLAINLNKKNVLSLGNSLDHKSWNSVKVDTFDTKKFEKGAVLVTFKEPIASGFTIDELKKGLTLNQATNLKDDVRSVLAAANTSKLYLLYETTYKITVDEQTAIPSLTKALSKTGDISLAEPNYEFQLIRVPNDPKYNDQWALPKIEAPGAWDIATGSSSIDVAIIDVGIDASHPDLKNNITDTLYMPDYLTGKKTPLIYPAPDECGYEHGTKIAGIIGAQGNNQIGITGINWQIKMLILGVANRTVPGCPKYLDSTVSALRYGADNGAKVMSLSLGSYFITPPQLLTDAIKYVSEKNVVIVAGAGNDNTDVANFYPAAYPGIIAVGASDLEDKKAQFSNYGSRLDVVAPGVNIYSTSTNGIYEASDGTSFSTPYVAGLAALILSVNPKLSPPEVKDIIVKNVDPLKTSADTSLFGKGRINAKKALAAAQQRLTSSSGEISGTVRATNGTVITTADVIMQLQKPDNTIIETTSTNSGYYSFSMLPYGTYSVVVKSAPGTLTNVTLDVGNPKKTIDFTIQSRSDGNNPGGTINGSQPGDCAKSSIANVNGHSSDMTTYFTIAGLLYYQQTDAPFNWNDRYKGCARIDLLKDGNVLATAYSDSADGSYAFAGVEKGGPYTILVTPPNDITIVSTNPLVYSDLHSSANLSHFPVKKKL